MKDLKFINFLKLRGSYGTAGNDKIGGYRYLYRYEFNKTNGRWTDYKHEIYNFGKTPVSQSGMREGTLGNDNVTWEINFGVNPTKYNTCIKSYLSNNNTLYTMNYSVKVNYNNT